MQIIKTPTQTGEIENNNKLAARHVGSVNNSKLRKNKNLSTIALCSVPINKKPNAMFGEPKQTALNNAPFEIIVRK